MGLKRKDGRKDRSPDWEGLKKMKFRINLTNLIFFLFQEMILSANVDIGEGITLDKTKARSLTHS